MTRFNESIGKVVISDLPLKLLVVDLDKANATLENLTEAVLTLPIHTSDITDFD